MATITTSTTGKRKIVYKQDADGVFRLKKVPASGTATHSHPQESSVDDHLNELIECAYQLPGTKKDDLVRDEVQVYPKDDKPAATGYLSKQEKRPVPKKTNTGATKSAGSKISQLKLNSTAFDSLGNFHLPSFGSGVVTTLILITSSPLISHYAVVIFNVAKIGIFWGILVGGISWYAGLIRLEDTDRIRGFVELVKGRFTADEPAEEPAEEDEEEEEHEDEEFDTKSRQHDVFEDLRRRKSSDPAVPRRRSESPTKLSNVLTTVTPFKPSQKDSYASKFQSTPDLTEKQAPKMPRTYTADTKGYSRRGSAHSAGKTRRLSSNSLDLIKTKTNQSIPSMELIDSSTSRHSPVKQYSYSQDDLEELPFINEVKLMSSADDTRSALPDLPSMNSNNGFKRLNSVMSKNSVLGTRVNYSKFLANVPGSNFD